MIKGKRRIILIITTIFFIGNFIFSSLLFYRSLNQLETKRFDRYRYLTNYYTEVINTALLAEEERLTKLSWQITPEASDEAILKLFKESANPALPKLSLTVCFAKDGRYVTEIPEEADGILDFRQRDWYKSAVNNPGVVYSAPYLSVDAQKYYVSLLKRIAVDGKILGGLCGDLRMDELVGLVRDMHIGRYGYAFIVARDGSVITHPHRETGENLRDIENGLFLPLLRAGQDGKIVYNFFYDNQKNVYGACPIGRSNWILVTYIDDVEMLVGVFWEALFFALGTFFLLGVLYLVGVVLILKYQQARLIKRHKAALNRRS